MEEEEQAGCLRKEKSSGMARPERWRKKKKNEGRMKAMHKKKLQLGKKNKEIESLRLEF